MIVLVLNCQSNDSSNKYPKNENIPESIEDYATQFLEDDRIHSVSIALYNNGQEYSLHFGEQTPGKSNPPTDSTLYELASVTKTFTGTMAAKAVLDQKISLDHKISRYLGNDYTNLIYEGRDIIIKDILTHTSGFPNFLPTTESKQKFLEEIKKIKISSAPGTEYNYSNTAPEIMAYILEKAYNRSYQELIHTYILDPNQMTQTKFSLNQKEKKLLIQGYNGDKEPQLHFENNLWGGIAGLHSTTQDLLKYMKYHLNESNKMVKESHKSFFTTPHDFDIGYYWNSIKDDKNICYRHHGGIWGMQNWLMIYPNDNIGIAVLSNASFEGSFLSKGIDDKLEDLAHKIYYSIKKLP